MLNRSYPSLLLSISLQLLLLLCKIKFYARQEFRMFECILYVHKWNTFKDCSWMPKAIMANIFAKLNWLLFSIWLCYNPTPIKYIFSCLLWVVWKTGYNRIMTGHLVIMCIKESMDRDFCGESGGWTSFCNAKSASLIPGWG